MFKYSNMHSLMSRSLKKQNGIEISEKEKQINRTYITTYLLSRNEKRVLVVCLVRGIMARNVQVGLNLLLK